MRLHNIMLMICCLWCIFGACAGNAQSAPVSPATKQISSQEARTALREVLARDEFSTYKKSARGFDFKNSALYRWLQKFEESIKRFFRNLAEWLDRLFPDREPSQNPGFFAQWGAKIVEFVLRYKYAIIAVLAILILYWIGLLISRAQISRHRRKQSATLDDLGEDPVARRKQEPSFWERSLQEAELFWQQGNQREALRILYRACLVLLDARGVLRYDETRANGEVLRELRRQGRGSVQRTLTPIVRSFDRSWYGFLNVTGDEFTAVMEQSHQFRTSVVEGQDAQ